MNSKVAIITRTKDRPAFLRRAISSVSSQTFEDYVHVIVNDGGDKGDIDDVVAGLDATARSKIRVFHRDQSSNAPDTIFNESIDRVDSEYFAIHDDDDTWKPEFLATTVEYLEANEHLAAVVVRTDRIDEVARSDGSFKAIKISRWMPDLKAISLYRQCIDNQLTPISTLFRRNSYIEAGKFDDSLPVIGDWEFGLRLLMKYEIDFINTEYALANYHHRPYTPNSAGNSSFAGNDKHRYYTNKIMNRYLREELVDGRLGVGYIMSSLRYEQSFLARIVDKLTPSFISKRLRGRIQR